jgi:hypothetical protein
MVKIKEVVLSLPDYRLGKELAGAGRVSFRRKSLAPDGDRPAEGGTVGSLID